MTDNITKLITRHINDAEAATRTSIIAYLRGERRKFERAYNEHIGTRRSFAPDDDREDYDLKTCRLDAKVSLLRTLIACIERGDDMVPR